MPDDAMMTARSVNDEDLERYELWAYMRAPHIMPGEVDWPVMVRSLIAEVRRLKAAQVDTHKVAREHETLDKAERTSPELDKALRILLNR